MMRELKHSRNFSQAVVACAALVRDAAKVAMAVLALLAGPPAADGQTRDGGTGPISGYMEMHLNKPIEDRDTPAPKAPAVLDFHRFVLLVHPPFFATGSASSVSWNSSTPLSKDSRKAASSSWSRPTWIFCVTGN